MRGLAHQGNKDREQGLNTQVNRAQVKPIIEGKTQEAKPKNQTKQKTRYRIRQEM